MEKKSTLANHLTLSVTIILGLLFGMQTAFALPPLEQQVPYHSYTYGIWDTSVPAHPAYEPERTLTGTDLGIGSLSDPEDLCRDNEGNICILDAGNERIVRISSDMKLLDVIDLASDDVYESGVELVEPLGICFDKNGLLYIADRGAEAVFVCNGDGTLIRKIMKPESDLLDEESLFQPTKLLVDHLGILYVLSFGSFEGAYTFDENGDFLGFFGSNKVNVTSNLLYDRFWRLISTKAQRERMARYVPIEYVNFSIDTDGFIYTVSNFGEQEQKGQVRKLNPLSQNILFKGQKPELAFFGDTENTYSNRVERSALVAVDVDDDGFISVLDSERGRIFQYDQDCNLLAIFGGYGNQVGTMTNPSDLVSSGGKIFVLDSVKSNLTVFSLTDYGRAIHEATSLYDDGFFEAALEPWFTALKMDRTNHLTLRGIGRAYERLGRYKEAMEYYRQGESRKFYSDAFHEYRTAALRKHFGLVMAVIILILLVPFFVWLYRKIRPKKNVAVDHARYVSKYRFPFYLCLHPFKGWEELKHEKQGSLWFANVMMAVWFILKIFEYQYTGFIFNGNRLDRMNLLIIFASSVGAIFLWSVCNWAVCTLFDGKGSFKEVWIFSAYSRMTWILMEIPILILSNVIVREEGFFLGLLMTLQTGLGLLQMLLAIRAVHQYSMKKTVASILITLLGIVLVILIVLLFVSLFAQIWSFAQTLSQEIMMRL